MGTSKETCSVVSWQFLLVLWKNFILQIRRPVGTVLELVIPPLAVVVLIGLKFGLFEVENRCFATFSSDPLTVPLPNNSYQIYYTPITNDTGIVFDRLDGNDLEYTLRLRHEVGEDKSWETRDSAPNFQPPGPRVTNNFYLQEGFVHLQNIVGEAIIRLMANPNMTDCNGTLEENITVSMRQLPYPEYRVDFFLITAASVLPFLIVLAFIYSSGVFTKELVLEKETRIRESMLMMGLQLWVLWTTWFIKQFVFLFISAFIMALLLKFGQVFPKSDFFLLLIFLIIFNISAISFSFFLSVWFNSARIGLLIGFLGWFLNYLPYVFVPGRYQTLTLGGKLGFCIFSNTCLGLGINALTLLEIQGQGAQWNNFYKAISLDDDFNLGYVFLMLIVDSIIYMLIAWYIDGVKPGQYGVPKPFYFPCLPTYWTGKPLKSRIAAANDADLYTRDNSDPTVHEEEPRGMQVGISIQNLTKIYDKSAFFGRNGGKKVAVDQLSLNMYEGQITALLGHNGAGKTTTISILTGLYTPTAGTAVINGYDIRSNMDQIRQSLGICPQHNVLFDRLTVLEHLKFFARLKGVRGKAVQEEADRMIEDVQLQDKRNTPSRALSGGMKRKLSAGIALIGGSRFVILDEPTSGIDPYARRAIWDLLVRHKEGRTILLTTHSMDEADLLGDRIAIMAEGKLRCSGSSLFLKSRYGVGYRMVVVKESSCNTARVTDLVTSLVPGGEKVTDVGAELSYVLPSSATENFPQLFEALEGRKSELGIAGFGISVTTMEEVFIKVGEGTDESLQERIQRTGTSTDIPVSPSHSPARSVTHSIRPQSPLQTNGPAEDGVNVDVVIKNKENSTPTTEAKPPKDFVPNSGLVLWCQQFCAMFLKRVYNSLRFWQAIITQLILPLIFVLIALILAVTLPNANENDPSRPLRIDNSALDADNRIVFYAELGDSSKGIFSFETVRPGDVGATRLENYTGDATEMLGYVQNTTDVNQCYNYTYQILDKFCASLSKGNFSSSDSEFKNKFGYRHCDDCLKCCQAEKAVVPTCTNPLTQTRETESEDLCPTPPQVSLSDVASGARGRVDSDTVFMDEALLRRAADMDPEVYIRRIQAGFVVSYRDPPYSVCGCSDTEFFATQYVGELAECTRVQEAEMYALRRDSELATPLAWLSNDCPQFDGSGNEAEGSTGYLFSGDYLVDGASANQLQISACQTNSTGEPLGCMSESFDNRSVGKYYPDQTPQITATVFYNNNPWHMSGAALNAFHNIWLRQASNNSELTLTVNNHPLPRTVDAEVDATQQNFNGFAIGTMVVFGYSFLIATFVLFPVKEKETKAKHLQFVSGVSVSSYWLATFAWDMLNSLIPIILSIILFAAFQVDGYTGAGLAGVFLLLVFTCWCTIPIVYTVSFLFSNSLVAFAVIFFFLFITSQVFLLLQFFITNQSVKDGLHYLCLLEPSYALSIGLNDLYINTIVKDTCTQSIDTQMACDINDDIRYVDNALSTDRPGVGVNLIYMAMEGVLFIILTLLLESKFFVSELRGAFCRKTENTTPEHMPAGEPLLLHGEDDDVGAERKKVMSGATSEEDVVVIKSLVKKYRRSLDGFSLRPAKLAVKGISLSIPNAECFGLLGVNGAGKTTTFSILTGDIAPTSGTALIAGYDIQTDLRKVQQRIGYCPQFDALIERLTGRELLTMFARLRGIPERLIKQAVEAEITRLDLSKYASKQCGKYSGGNKRKLSTALALVGNPPIIFLDEPTTGMDPATRRYLWDVLTGVTQEGRSIILTSHSMEECEALCTRLAIMVNGQFKCLGSIQHLKNKFGSGFYLQAKVGLAISTPHQNRAHQHQETEFAQSTTHGMQPSVIQSSTPAPTQQPHQSDITIDSHPLGGSGPFDTTSLHIFIKESFSGAVLLEEHQGSVTYQLPSAGLTWASVFRQLESNKERLDIIDYSVSQTTLEQVFINFAREQEEEVL